MNQRFLKSYSAFLNSSQSLHLSVHREGHCPCLHVFALVAVLTFTVTTVSDVKCSRRQAQGCRTAAVQVGVQAAQAVPDRGSCHSMCLSARWTGAGVPETSRGLAGVGWLHSSHVFSGPAQGAPSQYSSYQQGQGQQYGSYRASQTGPSAQQQRPYGYEQASILDVSPGRPTSLSKCDEGFSVVTSNNEMNQVAPGSIPAVIL